jgi:hypothetical protein
LPCGDKVRCVEGRRSKGAAGRSGEAALDAATLESSRAGRLQSTTTTSVAPVERCSGAKAARLLDPNFSFLSSSGATRAVCGFGFGAGRTREGGSL